jgi:bifunctional UDP-N-acetylglucosamine pyrophosphorylase/glucosamine-1-phosphate N-acetyltransferase
VIVVYGDHPTLVAQTLRDLLAAAEREQPLAALVAVRLDPAVPYGRYVRRDGRIVGIIEAHEDPTRYDAPIQMNSGMCCLRRDWLDEHIRKLPLSPKGEYYLTGLAELAAATPWPADPVLAIEAPADLGYGVNDRADLARAERIVRERINAEHMRAGVALVDPAATYIDADVAIGADTRVEPGCHLRGYTSIGRGCRIGPNTVIEDSRVADGVTIRSSWIEGSEIGAGTDVGPYAHFRPGTRVAPGVHIGNYVELKNAAVGSGTQIGHFSYIGDASLGERVNIGAGTVTCNYDGRAKHRTDIGDDAFIGSDTMLIAPVSVGEGSATGAGAVVTRSVGPGERVAGVPARPMPPKPPRAGDESD